MQTMKPYYIGPENTGLQNNLLPYLIPEDAWQFLFNAYVWRGRIRKRFGTYFIGANDLKSRLRVNLGNTDGSGNFSGTAPGAIFAVGQEFSIGSQVFTVIATGTPAAMLISGTATLATYNTTTGAVVINGASPGVPVYFYPGLPVMGLLTQETLDTNFNNTIGFDQQFAYFRTGGAWDRLGTYTWTGGNADFFWGLNFRGANAYDTYFYVVNYVNRIQWIPQGGSSWTELYPQLDSGATRYLQSCLLLVGFKDRLIALNTIENETGSNKSYVNRARWCQNGDPTNNANSWLDDTPGKGGYIDSQTQENIITAKFIKDRLIVYFEHSTWELVYTGNATLPFRWQQLNTELGAESTFSIVGFDKSALGVGNVGIHSCNGVNVSRIDQKIPDAVFNIHNSSDGPQRVYGIRDYYRELVYWTFPDDTGSPTYPTQVLVYNYENQSWAIFIDSFTCFGYFQKDSNLTWADLGSVYGTWAEWNEPWGGPQSQSQFPFIVAGNQQGYVFIVDADRSANEKSLYITNMDPTSSTLTIINHNLAVAEYIEITDCVGITSLNGIVVQVQSVVNDNQIVIDSAFAGTYLGNGKVTKISNLNLTSKQWNPGTQTGQTFRMPYIDFLLERTGEGQVSVDYFIDSTSGDSIQDQVVTDVILGSNVLYTQPEDLSTYQPNQVRIWHRYYTQVVAQFIQIKIFMNDAQMRNLAISQSDFQLDGIILYLMAQGRLIQ